MGFLVLSSPQLPVDFLPDPDIWDFDFTDWSIGLNDTIQVFKSTPSDLGNIANSRFGIATSSTPPPIAIGKSVEGSPHFAM